MDVASEAPRATGGGRAHKAESFADAARLKAWRQPPVRTYAGPALIDLRGEPSLIWLRGGGG